MNSPSGVAQNAPSTTIRQHPAGRALQGTQGQRLPGADDRRARSPVAGGPGHIQTEFTHARSDGDLQASAHAALAPSRPAEDHKHETAVRAPTRISAQKIRRSGRRVDRQRTVSSGGMFPASMRVAPNSPRTARRPAPDPPDPFRARGSVTSTAVCHSDRPSVKAARSRSWSTDSMAARAVRTQRKPHHGAAITAAYQVNDNSTREARRAVRRASAGAREGRSNSSRSRWAAEPRQGHQKVDEHALGRSSASRYASGVPTTAFRRSNGRHSDREDQRAPILRAHRTSM